jgi:hypothetical protein
MAQSAHNEILTAIAAVLVPSGALAPSLAAAGVTGAYDMRAVPQNAVFPYITTGDGYEIPDNAFGRRGYIYFATLHIWSQEKGTQEAGGIVAALNALLDQKSLNLPSQAHVYTMYNRSTFMADPDGLTLHVPVQYRIFTQE